MSWKGALLIVVVLVLGMYIGKNHPDMVASVSAGAL
jgi:hypothetical protein